MEAFLEREKVLRARTAKAAEESGRIATMRATGTKKRRKKAQDSAGTKRARTSSPDNGAAVVIVDSDSGHSSDDEVTRFLRSSRSPTPTPTAPRPRPKPRLVKKKSRGDDAIHISSDSDREPNAQQPRSVPVRRLVLSDDEEI